MNCGTIETAPKARTMIILRWRENPQRTEAATPTATTKPSIVDPKGQAANSANYFAKHHFQLAWTNEKNA